MRKRCIANNTNIAASSSSLLESKLLSLLVSLMGLGERGSPQFLPVPSMRGECCATQTMVDNTFAMLDAWRMRSRKLQFPVVCGLPVAATLRLNPGLTRGLCGRHLSLIAKLDQIFSSWINWDDFPIIVASTTVFPNHGQTLSDFMDISKIKKQNRGREDHGTFHIQVNSQYGVHSLYCKDPFWKSFVKIL